MSARHARGNYDDGYALARRGPSRRRRNSRLPVVVISLLPVAVIGFVLLGKFKLQPPANVYGTSARASRSVARSKPAITNAASRTNDRSLARIIVQSNRSDESNPRSIDAERVGLTNDMGAREREMSSTEGLQVGTIELRDEELPPWARQRRPTTEPEDSNVPVRRSGEFLKRKRSIASQLKRAKGPKDEYFLFSVSQEYFANGYNNRSGTRRDVGFHIVDGVDQTSSKLATYLTEYEDGSKTLPQGAKAPRRVWTFFGSYDTVDNAENALSYRMRRYTAAVQRREAGRRAIAARRLAAAQRVTRGGAGFRSRC